jgi:hypothetical protein
LVTHIPGREGFEDYDGYWSGYFTSRPNLKDFTRYGERVLRYAELLYAMSTMYNKPVSADIYQKLFVMRFGMAMMRMFYKSTFS